MSSEDLLSPSLVPPDSNRISRFQEAVSIETIAFERDKINYDEILQLHEFLEKAFPAIHGSGIVKREVINTHSLLYTVTGSNTALKPYILYAHMDVVPVTGQKWCVPPFEPCIKDGFVYGRGTIDMKHTLMGIFEALEYRLNENDLPVRGFFIALGHDEEVGGYAGAGHIVETLTSRIAQVEFLLDEGLVITDGMVPWIEGAYVAMIGVAEKGYASVKLTMDSLKPGHSSAPTKETNLGVLANAVVRLEKTPFPSMFGTSVETATLRGAAQNMVFPGWFILNNLWLFGAIVDNILAKDPATNALIRTTTAVVKFHSGLKENVLPASACAIVNHRLHPSQTIDDVMAFDKQVINDERIKLELLDNSREPSRVSPHSSEDFGFATISKSIKQSFPDTIVVPGLLIGNTDSFHFKDLTQNVYRFTPTIMKKEDVPRFHGENERISIENFHQLVNFYYRVTKNADL